jgi:hypothetical protein
VRWMVLYHPPDCIGFFQRVILQAGMERLQNTYLRLIFRIVNLSRNTTVWVGFYLASEVVSENKMRWAIDGFVTFKAAGEDGIFPGLLQHRIEIIIDHITKFYQVVILMNWLNHLGP